MLALINSPEPPFRLFLGDDALGLVEQKLEAMKTELHDWDALSRAANFAA
ncbi:MAG: hypothetical protein QM681_04740 [Novosphingobium sp.]